MLFLSSIIAEGIPESQTRAFNKVAVDKGVGIIGPATVGGIKVCLVFRIGICKVTYGSVRLTLMSKLLCFPLPSY